MTHLTLIDGFALIFRAYFAFFNRPLLSPEGQNISAIFGFFKSLFSLLDQYPTSHLVVAFESKVPTLREQKFPQYKAHRDKAPDDLLEQIPMIEKILGILGIPVLSADGYEADDVIATLSRQCQNQSTPCMIVSGDKDLLQLVGGSVQVLKPEKSGYSLLDAQGVKEEKGVSPGQIVDYLALIGDTSDNVPGVQGIGPKTAATLLGEYGTLEGIYDHLEEIKSENQRKKLQEGRESAFLSKDLVTLYFDVEVGLPWEECLWAPVNLTEAAREFENIGSQSLVDQTLSLAGEKVENSNQLRHQERGEYEGITTVARCQELLEQGRQAGYLAFDVETDGLDPMQAQLVGFSFSWEEGKGYYFPLIAGGKDILPWNEVKPVLEKVLLDPQVKIIGQNIKFDWKVLSRYGISIPKIYFDTMVAAWMLESGQSGYGMDELAESYLNYKTLTYKDTVAKGENFGDVALEKAVPYAAEDADITFRLYLELEKRLKAQGLAQLFFELEMPVLDILCRMEAQGILLDAEALEDYSLELGRELESLERQVWELCGKEFNLSSTKQLQEVLFEDRKLTPVKKTKTGYSTDSSVLEILAKEDPVPERILRYRLLSKLKSTYVDALPALVNPKTSRVHTSFGLTGTATGRLSSRDPNLQNIPIKDEEGRRIRRAFIAPQGWVLVAADYSQIELVVLAHLSQDKNLSQAFRDGQDIHRRTAALVFGLFEEMVSPEQRRMAKAINFGIMYGMSAFRLSNDLGIPRKQASDFIEAYFREFSQIQKFIEKKAEEAQSTGKVKTLLGHERRIPTINSRNKTEQMAAQRIAVNTPIQGSAADIVKLAMIKVSDRLQKEGLQGRILLQVHDELLLECPEEESQKISDLLKEEMEKAVELSVPLRVNVEVGKNWGEFHS